MNSDLLTRYSCVITCLVISLSSIGCGGTTGSLPLVSEELALPLRNAGWTYVDMPRQLLGAGSIVSVTDVDGIRFRGRIGDCVPPEALEVTEGPVAIKGLFSSSKSLSLDAFLGFHSIKIGPKLQSIRTVKLKIGKADEVALNEIKLMQWLNNNKNNLSPLCIRYLKGHDGNEQQKLQGGIYILMNVLRVTGYSYTFEDGKGGSIDIRPGHLGEFVEFEAGAKADLKDGGTIEIEEPVYIAFKKANVINFDRPLGAATAKIDTAEEIMKRRIEVLSH